MDMLIQGCGAGTQAASFRADRKKRCDWSVLPASSEAPPSAKSKTGKRISATPKK